jgi:hypothetical protein
MIVAHPIHFLALGEYSMCLQLETFIFKIVVSIEIMQLANAP